MLNNSHDVPSSEESIKDPTPDGTGALVVDLLEALREFRRTLRAHIGTVQRTEWGSLTIHQLDALVALDERSLTMGELCGELDITESAATALSDRLVSRGLVERCGDPRDRRLVRLCLSQQARDLAKRYRETLYGQARAALSTLGAEELTALRRLCDALEKVRSPDS